MGQLLRHRRLGRGRADRIAVRRHHAYCAKADDGCAGSQRRLWHADNRSFRRRFAVVGAYSRPVASDHRPRRPLGCHWIMRTDLCPQHHPAHAGARSVRTGIRGLVVSCCAAGGGIRDTGAVGTSLHLLTRARACLGWAPRHCCCSSSAFTTPGTPSFTTYFSASAAQTTINAECRQSCRALKRNDLG